MWEAGCLMAKRTAGCWWVTSRVTSYVWKCFRASSMMRRIDALDVRASEGQSQRSRLCKVMNNVRVLVTCPGTYLSREHCMNSGFCLKWQCHFFLSRWNKAKRWKERVVFVDEVKTAPTHSHSTLSSELASDSFSYLFFNFCSLVLIVRNDTNTTTRNIPKQPQPPNEPSLGILGTKSKNTVIPQRNFNNNIPKTAKVTAEAFIKNVVNDDDGDSPLSITTVSASPEDKSTMQNNTDVGDTTSEPSTNGKKNCQMKLLIICDFILSVLSIWTSFF